MLLLTGTAEQALLDLIASQNTLPVPLRPHSLYFGTIKPLADGRVQVPAVTMYDSEYDGYVKFTYTRLNLSKAYGDIKPIVRQIGYPSLHRLLPVINQALGLALTPADVLDVAFDWLGSNEQLNIRVVAAPTSLGYEGQFLLQYTRIRPHLKDVVNKVTLPVLNHPSDPTTGKKSLSMTMWGIDFTGNDRELQIFPTRTWMNPNALKIMMAERGFPNWPQAIPGCLAMYSTKERVDANKAFTTLIIQSKIDYPGYLGDAYFHFNRA